MFPCLVLKCCWSQTPLLCVRLTAGRGEGGFGSLRVWSEGLESVESAAAWRGAVDDPSGDGRSTTRRLARGGGGAGCLDRHEQQERNIPLLPTDPSRLLGSCVAARARVCAPSLSFLAYASSRRPTRDCCSSDMRSLSTTEIQHQRRTNGARVSLAFVTASPEAYGLRHLSAPVAGFALPGALQYSVDVALDQLRLGIDRVFLLLEKKGDGCATVRLCLCLSASTYAYAPCARTA